MPGIMEKSVTCPVCHQKSRVADCRQVTPKGSDLSGDDGKTQVNTDLTDKYISPNFTIGQLRDKVTGQTWTLRPGRNVIGRDASSCTADIRIPTSNKRLSRSHLVINVVKQEGVGFVHYISLFKEEVNKTMVGGCELEYGDTLKLTDGCSIELPGVSLRFELPDSDKTEI